MKRKRSGIILMVFGAVVALLAGVAVFVVAPKAAPATSNPEATKKGKVVMVTQAIEERELVQPAYIREVELALDAIPPNAITKRDEIANKMTTVKLYPNLPILKEQVSTKSATDAYAFKLETGKVLVAVNYPAATNMVNSGAIRPGDRVDLIVTMQGKEGVQIAPTMQNITVTAVGALVPGNLPTAKTGTAATGVSTLLFFEVPEQDALILKYLETIGAGGSNSNALGVDVVLRPAGDNDTPQTQLVDIDFMVNKFKLQKPPVKQ